MSFCVVNTRFSPKNRAFSALLRARGVGEIIEFPCSEIVAITAQEADKVKGDLQKIAEDSCLVFTSPNGVEKTFEVFKDIESDLKKVQKVAVIGAKTAEVASSYGFEVSYIGENSNSQDFADELLTYLNTRTTGGTKLVFLRGNLANENLPRSFSEAGFEVLDIAVYQTKKPEYVSKISQELLEKMALLKEQGGEAKPSILLTFCSSQAVRNFLSFIEDNKAILREDSEEIIRKIPVAVLGSTTAKTVEEFGLRLEIVASDTSIDALADDIGRYLF